MLMQSLTHSVMALISSPSECHYPNSQSRHVARTCVPSFVTPLTSYLFVVDQIPIVCKAKQQPSGGEKAVCIAFDDSCNRNVMDMADIKTASSLRSHILDVGRELCQELSKTQLKLLLKSTQWRTALPGSS